jgi:hypothetical protein
MTNIAGQQMLHNTHIWIGGTTVGALFSVMLRAAWLIAGKEIGMGYFVVVIGMLLAVLIVFCLVYILSRKPDDPATEAGLMPLSLRRILIGYFLLVGALFMALLVDLNMMDFPEAAVSIQITPPPTPTPPPTTSGTPGQQSSADKSSSSKSSTDKSSTDKSSTDKSSTDKSSADKSSADKSSTDKSSADKSSADKSSSTDPVILQVIPRITAGSPPTIYIAVYGLNLGNATIRLNGKERGTSLIGPGLLEAQPETSDVQGKGTMTVDVVTKDNLKKISNCIIVPVEKPTAPLELGWFTPPYLTREIQLLLIVVIAGGLGCLIHGLKSIAAFIGNRIAISSWFWWYITRPLLGMAMAMVFYALLRGGFLAGTPSDAKVISPFGVLGIGALVGMFTDKAIGKLADIFDMLFRSKADDAAKDKLSSGSPTVTQLLPNSVKAGSPAATLTIKGDHLEKIVKVKVGQDERPVKSPSTSQQVTVDLLATDLAAPAHDITITLVDSDNKTFNAGVLHVTA